MCTTYQEFPLVHLCTAKMSEMRCAVGLVHRMAPVRLQGPFQRGDAGAAKLEQEGRKLAGSSLPR